MKALVLAFVCLTVVACTVPAGTPSPTPAGTLTGTPAPTPTVTPSPSAQASGPPTASLTDCDAVDEDVPSAGWQGASGQMFGSFVLRNVGSTPCVAVEPTAVGLQDAAGQPLAVREFKEVSRTPARTVLLPDLPLPSDGSPLPTGFGSIAFIWSNWCRADPARPVALVVHLGSVVTRVVPVVQSGSIPRCDAPGAPSLLDVYPLDTLPGSPSIVTPSPSR